MRFPHLNAFLATVLALLALAACTPDLSNTDAADADESDVGHEDGHEHGELYDPHDPAPGADAQATAEAWLAAFTAGGADTAVWVEELAPFCFRSYCELLADTDPDRIPTAAPTGPAEVAATERADAVVATAPAEGGAWTVALLATADGAWQVYDCTWTAS